MEKIKFEKGGLYQVKIKDIRVINKNNGVFGYHLDYPDTNQPILGMGGGLLELNDCSVPSDAACTFFVRIPEEGADMVLHFHLKGETQTLMNYTSEITKIEEKERVVKII
jgi:hypothetical protein